MRNIQMNDIYINFLLASHRFMDLFVTRITVAQIRYGKSITPRIIPIIISISKLVGLTFS